MEAIFLQSDIIWTQLETLFLASLENNCNVGLMPSTGTIILKWKQLVPLFLASLMLPQVAIVTLLDVEPISDLLTAGRRSKTSKTSRAKTILSKTCPLGILRRPGFVIGWGENWEAASAADKMAWKMAHETILQWWRKGGWDDKGEKSPKFFLLYAFYIHFLLSL